MKEFFSKCDQISSFPADLVTFSEKVLNSKFPFTKKTGEDLSLSFYNPLLILTSD